METMLQAIERLRARGYGLDLFPADRGRLRCGGCGEIFEADAATIDEIVRFEGVSNPDDQAILAAVVTPCGHRGLFSAAYGVYASADDAAALTALTVR
jgi:hypothetical protein